MIGLILLELVGIMSALGIWNIWVIDTRGHVTGIIFVSVISLVYLLFNGQVGVIFKIIKYVLSPNYKVDSHLENKYLIELRKLGSYIGILGFVGLPSIILLNNWEFIGRPVIGGGMAITGAIIFYTLIIETTFIMPLLLGVQLKYQKMIIVR